MYIRMKFTVTVILLIIQLSFTRAVDLDRASEHLQTDLGKSSILTSTFDLPLEEQISDDNKNSVKIKRDLTLKNDKTTADAIVFDIKSRQFKKALKKTQDLNNLKGTMNYVIGEVYNNDLHNLDLILKFVDSDQSETAASFAIYKALNNEMNNNNHNDYLLRLKVMKSFNSKPFDLEAPSVNKLKNKLHNAVISSTVEELKNALKTKDSSATSRISENIHDYSPKSFNNVIRKALNEAFDEINTRYLVTFFMSHKYAEQSMSVYSAVFKNLKKRNSLDQSVVVTLASGIKEALDKSLDSEARKEGERLKDVLPLSTKNIAFASPVYIVNENGEYFYAASDGFNYDSERRSVFTWTPKDKVSQGKWIIERRGDAYRIKNHRSETHSEYLLRSLVPTADDYSFIFTWIPGGTDDYAPGQFDWEFEPSGDYVYIKSKYRGEYLYVTKDYEGIDRTDRRYVYTHRSGNKVDGSLWKIVQ